MIDLGVIITAAIGIVTTFCSALFTWIFSKRKYNAEAASNEIENLKKSLEFYEEIVRDNNKKLQFYINLAEENRVEVYRLKGIIHRLLNNSCLNNSCGNREFYTEDQIREILGEISPINSKKDEINSKED